MSSDLTELVYFDSELDLTSSVRVVETATIVPTVSDAVAVDQPVRTAFLAKEYQDWCWEDLRDYVAREIIQRFGVFPRDPRKEYGIFTSFVNRWGIEMAVAIAKYAYETHDGIWKGAPVRMQRFCKGSDPYFSVPIATYLRQHT